MEEDAVVAPVHEPLSGKLVNEPHRKLRVCVLHASLEGSCSTFKDVDPHAKVRCVGRTSPLRSRGTERVLTCSVCAHSRRRTTRMGATSGVLRSCARRRQWLSFWSWCQKSYSRAVSAAAYYQ